jgi:hypothetical protein
MLRLGTVLKTCKVQTNRHVAATIILIHEQ